MLASVPSEYSALLVYLGFIVLIFIGALVWHRYREHLKRKYPLINYHSNDPENEGRKITHHA